MGNHQRNVGNYKSALEGLKGLAATYLSAASILAAGRQILNTNAEIADSLADVRRTAGLTAAEAENLSEQLKKIDTRTSLKGLLEISTIGGQLGIAKDQLAGFTTAVDQLSVALAGELQGGAEGIAKSLGVLDNVFGVTTSNAGDVEKSYNQIGSAILGLGQSGLATGDYLTDFSERVGGLAKQFGISLPVVLSYGAVLQESGVSAEVAGSSFNRLISNLATNREKFFAVAKIADANLTLKEFTNIINTDTNRALSLFFAGLQKGGNTTTAFNDILKTLKLTGAGVSQAVAALAGHQEDLNGHIVQATKDFDEASLSAEQFALKNDNLAGSVDKLGNAFENAVSKGKIRDFFKSIIDGLTAAVKSFDKFVNSSSWTEFKHRLLDRDGGDAWALSTNFSSNQQRTSVNQAFLYPSGVTPESMEEKLKSRGEKWNQQYLKNLKKTMDQAKEMADEYEKGVASGKLKENSTTVADYKTNYNKAKTYYEDVAKLQEKFGFGVKPKKKIEGTEVSVVPIVDEKKAASALNAQRALQARIDDLNAKGRLKQENADEQEIEAVKRKYQALRKEAEAFNKNPKNKGLKVDAGGLYKAESIETDALIDKQAATKLKTTLEDERKIYEEFERYKSNFGLAAAKERYDKKINIDKTYLERLQQLEDDILNPEKSKGADGEYDGKSEQQLKEIRDRIEKEKLEEQKKYDALLKEFMGYAEKRKVLEEQYERDILALGNNEAAKANRKKRYDEDLNALTEANTKKLSEYEKLFEGIEQLSRKEALLVIDKARAILQSDKNAGLVSEKVAKETEELFDKVTKSVVSGTKEAGEELISLANQIDQLVSSVSGIDEVFAKVLSTVSNVVGQVGNINKGMSEFKTASGKGANGMKDFSQLGQLTAGLGIFGAGMSIFSSVIKLFDRSAQREEQAAYSRDLQNKQTEALNKALERQVALLDQVYGTERITNYSLAIKQATQNQEKYTAELAGRYLMTGDKFLDDLISQINSGKKTGYGVNQAIVNNVLEGKIGSVKGLPTNDLNALQILLDEKKLDANTATIVENLIKAVEIAQELKNKMNADLTGTSIAQLADDFISTLTDGTQDFGKTFEETIQKSILNGFKGELIRKQLQAFYTQFADLSEGGLTSAEIETLRKSYLQASEKAKKDLEDLSKATGIDLTGSSKSKQGELSKGIQGITETTANRLEAEFGGMRLAQLQTNAILTPMGNNIGHLYRIAMDNFAVQQQIEKNTYRTANNTDRLRAIEDAIVSIDKKTANTGAILRGAGLT